MTKIMLVEDDNNLREIYEARLSAEGYDIVSAPDGEAALAIAANERPDLIISDVMMPKISGFEMLDILRNTASLRDVKVIMLTALGQSEDNARADALGADKYLVKSQVTLEDIVKATHELLDEPTASAPAAATDQQPAADNSEAEESPETNAPLKPQVEQPMATNFDPDMVMHDPVEETPSVASPEISAQSEPALANLEIVEPPTTQDDTNSSRNDGQTIASDDTSVDDHSSTDTPDIDTTDTTSSSSDATTEQAEEPVEDLNLADISTVSVTQPATNTAETSSDMDAAPSLDSSPQPHETENSVAEAKSDSLTPPAENSEDTSDGHSDASTTETSTEDAKQPDENFQIPEPVISTETSVPSPDKSEETNDAAPAEAGQSEAIKPTAFTLPEAQSVSPTAAPETATTAPVFQSEEETDTNEDDKDDTNEPKSDDGPEDGPSEHSEPSESDHSEKEGDRPSFLVGSAAKSPTAEPGTTSSTEKPNEPTVAPATDAPRLDLPEADHSPEQETAKKPEPTAEMVSLPAAVEKVASTPENDDSADSQNEHSSQQQVGAALPQDVAEEEALIQAQIDSFINGTGTGGVNITDETVPTPQAQDIKKAPSPLIASLINPTEQPAETQAETISLPEVPKTQEVRQETTVEPPTRPEVTVEPPVTPVVVQEPAIAPEPTPDVQAVAAPPETPAPATAGEQTIAPVQAPPATEPQTVPSDLEPVKNLAELAKAEALETNHVAGKKKIIAPISEPKLDIHQLMELEDARTSAQQAQVAVSAPAASPPPAAAQVTTETQQSAPVGPQPSVHSDEADEESVIAKPLRKIISWAESGDKKAEEPTAEPGQTTQKGFDPNAIAL